MIVLGDRPESLRQWCRTVDVIAQPDNPYTAVFDQTPVLLCRGLKHNLQEVRPMLKNWN